MDGIAVERPFHAAFNQPEPQFTDWDGDGWVDMFINDRDGSVQYFRRFPGLNDSGLPDFRLMNRHFQSMNVGLWFTFYDFDGDGDQDILSHTAGTDQVSYWENADSTYLLVTDRLLTDSGNPLYGGQVVIPTVTDINDDGFGDYFIGDISGRLTYYQGMGFSDRPSFSFITNQFEGIQIIWTPARHGANAIDFYDLDDDGDKDLIWGDLYQPGLFYLENFGDNVSPDFNQDFLVTNFGELAGIQTSGFNIPRLVDLDNDGDGDLVCGTLSGQYGVDYSRNLIMAQNTGSVNNPIFAYVTSELLVGLDFISESHPVWADIDGDNDPDLMVGNAFNPANYGWSGQMFYHENIGTTMEPELILRDSMAVFPYPGSNIAPTFCDLDGDGDLDGFYGDFNGYVHWYENTGSISEPVWVDQGNFLNLDLSGYAVPTFGDLDGDGDQDFIVGDREGRISIFYNQGTVQQPIFPATADREINIGEFVSPAYWYDNRILAGDLAGELKELIIESTEISIIVHQIPWCGKQIAPTVLYPDSTSPLLIGSRDGGLQYLVPVLPLAIAGNTRAKLSRMIPAIYPNPTNGALTLSLVLTEPDFLTIALYNILGCRVSTIAEGNFISGQHTFSVQMHHASGTYFIRVNSTQGRATRKIIYLK